MRLASRRRTATGSLAALALGLGAIGLRPAAAGPDAPPSVCRASAEILSMPDPLVTCGVARLEVRVRPTCDARPVHLVYILNATSVLTDNGLYYLQWRLGESIRVLNLYNNRNVRVAAVRVTETDALVAQGFTSDVGPAFHGLHAHSAAYGCRRCGLERALGLLREARADVAPERPAEFIAFFGYLGHEEEERALAELARTIHAEGVTFIGPDRDLATSDRYWTGGRWPMNLVFRNVGLDFKGTALERLRLELGLPSGLKPVAHSASPPLLEAGAGEPLAWAFAYPPTGALTVSLEVEVAAPPAVGVGLLAALTDVRGHENTQDLGAAGPSAAVDGCRAATPGPGEPTATAAPTRVAPTPGPTPTLRGKRVVPAYLPAVLREPCATSGRQVDAVLVVDASSSMRSADHDAVAEAAAAGEAFVGVLRRAADGLPAGARRVGLVRFDAAAEVVLPLTGDWEAAGRALAALRAATVRPGTRLDAGLAAALDHLAAEGDAGHRPAIVLLTDGTQVHDLDRVLAQALRARAGGVDVYTVGLGELYDATLLEQVAGVPERFAAAAEEAELRRIYEALAEEIRCGA